MNLVNQIAHTIWEIRQELFLDGNAQHDYELAEEYLKNHKCIGYNKIYTWVMELDEFMIKLDNKLKI